MAILTFLSAAAQAPKGPWAWILLDLLDFVVNYGWRVVLFTILLKIVLSPLDIYQRYKARKNQKISIRIKPEMEKLQKIYGHDPQLLSKKQMELNKKSGISMFSSCLPAIVTLIIFITLLYTGLQPISQYKNFTEYEQLNAEYHRVYDEKYDSEYALLGTAENRAAVKAEITPERNEEIRTGARNEIIEQLYKSAYDAAIAEGKSEEDAKALGDAAKAKIDDAENLVKVTELENAKIDAEVENTIKASANAVAVEPAQVAVKALYESDVKESFLWVKNIWSADNPWKAPINKYSDFKTNVGKYATDYKKAGFESEDEFRTFISEAEYNTVMGKLLDDPEYNKSNGYLILPLLTVLMSIAMQIVSFRQQKNSGQSNAQSEMSMKMMMLIMPIMMGFFALSYTAAFSVYLIMNYVGSLLIALISALIIKIIDHKIDREQVTQVQKYGRPDFSDRNNDNK